LGVLLYFRRNTGAHASGKKTKVMRMRMMEMELELELGVFQGVQRGVCDIWVLGHPKMLRAIASRHLLPLLSSYSYYQLCTKLFRVL
jgi:hypothetical protein